MSLSTAREVAKGFSFVSWKEWDPKAFMIQTTFDKALEKRKPSSTSPMTYINIIWNNPKYRGSTLIIITPQMDLFGINRRKDSNNKELEVDAWTLRWRLKSNLDQYIDENQREFHRKLEEFDAELQRQIDAMMETANSNNKNPNRKQKERSYMGLVRVPESITADYLYTSCQLMFDSKNEMLKDFTLIQVNTTQEEWNKMDTADFMEKYSLRPDRYTFKYVPPSYLPLLGGEPLPDKNEYKEMIPPYSSGVQFMEIGSFGFTAMMLSVTPKIHRCLFYSEPRAISMNTDLADELATYTNNTKPAVTSNAVDSISVFGGGSKRKADEVSTVADNDSSSLDETTPKKIKIEEAVPVVSSTEDENQPASKKVKVEDAVAAAPVAVKVASSLGKPSSSSNTSSSSAAAPSKSTTTTSGAKPVSSTSSSSSGNKTATGSNSAAPPTIKKPVSSSSSGAAATSSKSTLQGSLDKL